MTKLLTLLFLCSAIQSFAQEQTPVQLTLCAVYSTANNSISRYNGTEKGAIIIRLHANGTYSHTELTNAFGGQRTTLGTYSIEGNKITFSSDAGQTSVYAITQMDGAITKLVAGQRTMYFVRSAES